jgi:DNA polymerase-3 subunit epsilon
METVAVLDFETTGLSPQYGDRATEIAIALVQAGVVVDRFQSLMNSGCRIPAEITQLTGITNAMVAAAPPAATVMREAARFVGKLPLVAHNASFDKKFWISELERLSIVPSSSFACTMLLSRRLYPNASNHQLSTLVRLLGLPPAVRAHRAMADTEMASHLWCRIQKDVSDTYGIQVVTHTLLMRVQRTPRLKMPALLQSCAQAV